jgi:hypothetical protein
MSQATLKYPRPYMVLETWSNVPDHYSHSTIFHIWVSQLMSQVILDHYSKAIILPPDHMWCSQTMSQAILKYPRPYIVLDNNVPDHYSHSIYGSHNYCPRSFWNIPDHHSEAIIFPQTICGPHKQYPRPLLIWHNLDPDHICVSHTMSQAILKYPRPLISYHNLVSISACQPLCTYTTTQSVVSSRFLSVSCCHFATPVLCVHLITSFLDSW